MYQIKKIESLNEFKKCKEKNGYIIITSPIQISIHKSSCSYLNEANFSRKSHSKTRKGEYIWITKIEMVEKKFDSVKPCSYCNPFKKRLTFY